MSVSMPVANDLDAERLRIARELHDVISYGFATISLQAGAAVHIVDQKPEQALEALRAIKVASKEALEELRGILGLLRQTSGSYAPTVGLDGLETLAATTTRAGVQTRLEVYPGRSEALPAAVGLAAYRIVQEALANVLRHADAGSALVSVALDGQELFITVEDDGAGHLESKKPAADGSGFGILGMRERAAALGGNLEAGPLPEGGFRVRASLPISVYS
jgi:signal transduction histidine kinase